MAVVTDINKVNMGNALNDNSAGYSIYIFASSKVKDPEMNIVEQQICSQGID